MPSFNLFPLPIVFLFMLSFLSLTSHIAAQNYLYHICANTTFTDNGSHLSSLRSLLSSLSSFATGNVKFYGLSSPTLSISTNASSKIQVSGHNISIPIHSIFLCRGDVSTEVCRRCVGNATEELVSKCSRERAAVIWYDECMVRYSNESIFSTVAVRPRIHLLNTQNITEPDRFNRLLNTTMTALASQASNVPTGAKKFGTRKVNFSLFQNLYTLVECTPDLSSTDCKSCLQAAINRLPICCGAKQGARALFPSCHVEYELYIFYNNESMAATLTSVPPPGLALPPPPPASVTGPKGESKILTVTTIAIVAPIAVSLLVPFLLG